MLIGTIKYNDNIFDVAGVDNTTSMSFLVSAREYAGVETLDGIKDSAGSFDRWIRINQTTIKSQALNDEFNMHFSAIMRYAKSNCYSAYKDMLFEQARDEFSPEVSSIFNIPNVGKVKLTLGFVSEVHIETQFIKIDLVQEDRDDLQFVDFDAKSKAVKLNMQTLGFEPFTQTKTSVTEGFYGSLQEIIDNNPLKNYEWLLQRKYYIVSDSELESIISYFRTTKKKIAVDFETTGLNINFKSKIGQADVAVGIILSDTPGVSYYFPMQHKAIVNLCGGDHEYFMTTYMKSILENQKIVCHNTAFDWKVAYIYDINMNVVDDTMVAFQCTYGYRYKGYATSLKALAKSIFGRDSLELSDLVSASKWGKTDVKFWDLPYELVRLYGCADGDNTIEILEYIDRIDLLGSYNARKIYEMEVIFAKCCAYQEFYGHMVDVDDIPQLQSDNDIILAKNYRKMAEIIGHDFNPASPQQMCKILYEELGLPEQTKLEAGKTKVTVDKNARKALLDYEDDNGNLLYPIVLYYQEWSDANTIKKNFLKGLGELATPDGYMFTSVLQMGTTTGRVSVSKPNYQSYNKPVKLRIKARPNYYMTDNDYSSIEYRVLACLSGQGQLIKAFFDPDLNYHTYQAARIFGIPYEAVTEALRKMAKGINFGLPYGMEDPSLGARVFGARSKENTIKAAKVRAKYFEGQELVKVFFDTVRDNGVKNNYTETFFGRRRYYDRTKYDIGSIRRQAGNAVIQGTAADIYKLGVCRAFLAICKNGWLGKVLMPAFVHDETLFEVHKSIDPVVWMKVVKEAFELKVDGWCPLYIGFGYGDNWYQAKSTEIPVQLQDSLIAQYGENGYPDWDGDTKKFCNFIESSIDNYELDVVKNFVTSEENQGKVIKPVPNTYLIQHANKFVKDYLKAKAKFINENNMTALVSYDELKEYLHSQGKYMNEIEPKKLMGYKADYLAERLSLDDLKARLEKANKDSGVVSKIYEYCTQVCNVVYLEEFRKISKTQEALDAFCKVMGLNRDSIDIKNTEEVKPADSPNTEPIMVEKTEDEIEQEIMNAKLSRINILGMYLDVDKQEVIFKLCNNAVLMDLIKKKLNRENRGYAVKLYDFTNNIMYDTPSYISAEKVSEVQQLYISAGGR